MKLRALGTLPILRMIIRQYAERTVFSLVFFIIPGIVTFIKISIISHDILIILGEVCPKATHKEAPIRIQKTEILRQLRLILPEELIQENIPLSTLTTMRVGGPAALLVAPKDILQIREVLRYLHKESIPFVVLGKGSNVLASDEGYDSVILQLTNLQQITVEGNKLRAQGGASLIAMARAAQSAGLAGLEFASGIPGTLGGALYMNAGAYGFEMQDVVLEVEAVDERGELLTLGVDDLNFGYRSSVFREKSLVAVSSLLQLKQDDPDVIMDRMRELSEKRRAKQPLEWPSAGSTFKRPEGHFAGALIEGAGLKGFSVGDAQVSEKHAGFIINRGGATCAQVKELIHLVQQRVLEKNAVLLEPEVRYLSSQGFAPLQ